MSEEKQLIEFRELYDSLSDTGKRLAQCKLALLASMDTTSRYCKGVNEMDTPKIGK